jgi:hypothetical protein
LTLAGAGLKISHPMTTANKVTILRILLIPFFVAAVLYYVRTGIEGYRFAGLLCFAVAAICDGVDGYIARHYNQWSELGTILDPLADKLLLVSAVVVLSFKNEGRLEQIPLWLTVTIIGRDLLLLAQMASVIWVLLKWHPVALDYVVAGAAICTAVSGLWYVYDGMKQLGAHPASSPTPPGNLPKF